jgi:hypothetical protein
VSGDRRTSTRQLADLAWFITKAHVDAARHDLRGQVRWVAAAVTVLARAFTDYGRRRVSR